MKWPTVKLEQVTIRIRNGLNIKQTSDAGGLPITRIETISNQVIDPDKVGFAGIQDGEKSDWYLKPGEILFSHINSEERIGNCALYDGEPYPLIHGMNLLCLTPNENKILPKFLFYSIRSPQFHQSLKPIIKRAVNQASVSISNLKNLRIPLPPLSEQRRIVEILDQANALRKKRAEADAKAARIIPALFYKMFGDPATNPKGWPVKPLSELFEQDKVMLDEVTGNSLPYIGLEHIESNTGRILINETEGKKIDVRGTSFLFSHKHVLYGKLRPYLNKVALPSYEGRCSTELVPLLPKSETPREFVAAYLRLPFIVNAAMSSNKGSRMPRTDMNLLINMIVPIPPIKLQHKFAKAFRSIERSLANMQRVKETIENLFTVLLHRAFTGNLTAKWREAHMKELLEEMEHQVKILNRQSGQ